MLVSSSSNDVKQHVSNQLIHDCKVGTSPENVLIQKSKCEKPGQY